MSIFTIVTQRKFKISQKSEINIQWPSLDDDFLRTMFETVNLIYFRRKWYQWIPHDAFFPHMLLHFVH